MGNPPKEFECPIDRRKIFQHKADLERRALIQGWKRFMTAVGVPSGFTEVGHYTQYAESLEKIGFLIKASKAYVYLGGII